MDGAEDAGKFKSTLEEYEVGVVVLRNKDALPDGSDRGRDIDGLVV
jgi:hypothetical protein